MALYIGDKKIAITSGTPMDTHSDATATESDILNGKIAYGATGKVIGTIPSKAGATYTPSDSVQTISAGQYLSGDQVISAVPTETKTVTPSESAQTITPTSGKFISSVTVEGTGTINHYYTGSTDPSSSLGSDGDIYLKV